MSEFMAPEYTRMLLFTLDDGSKFMKLRGRMPEGGGTLEDAYCDAIGGTIGQWLEDHPDYRLLSYRPIRD